MAAFSARMFTLCRSYEELYYYHKSGAVDEWVWHSIHSMMSDLFTNRGIREWWSVRGVWFSDEFQSVIGPLTEQSAGDLESDYETRASLTWSKDD